jgi:integrase
MARRGNGEGSIMQRDDGRWMGRIMWNGQRKAVYGRTRREVQQKLDKVKHDLSAGLPIPGERLTLKRYLADWHETVKPTLAPSSYFRYGDSIRHITSVLGNVALSKLTPQQLQLAYAKKLDELAPGTVSDMHTMLKQALNDAVRLNLLARNPCAYVKPPRAQHKEIHPLDEGQAMRFLEAVRGDRLEALYVLALTTGMRLGELLGLRWQDVDMARHTITVQQNMQRVRGLKGGFRPASPKTAHSKRTIALTEMAVDALRAHWQAHQLEGHRSALVFCTRSGGHYHNPRIIATQWFNEHLDKAGLPHIYHFHTLRHTCATLLLSRGVNVKVVSELLGHSNISITLNIYSHVLPPMQQSAVTAMASLLDSHEPGKIVDQIEGSVS